MERAAYRRRLRSVEEEESIMAWTTPKLVEICIGLEINGYLPAEF
jgi:coenzyme PQQ precursor peptide PqqA